MALRGLQDKVVIVTGAASGIGRATASRLVAEGSRVALVDIDSRAVAAAAGQLDADDERVMALAGDVSSEADVERYFAAAVERFGRLDALHNNAGIEGPVMPLADFELHEFERLVQVNLVGIFLNLRQMVRTARRLGTPAAIVNTSSGTGLHGVPGLGAYGATKAAIIGLTRAAAIENAAERVRVNAIAPGPVDTPLFGRFEPQFRSRAEELLPQGRLGSAAEVAALAAFLLSDEAPFITGAVYSIDGGETA
jgi:NAD(P)-dependent dehydrogenase (short-subunit alcohol dehydrogenase family)